MAWDEDDDTTIYHVVLNHEEQYSVWPEYKEISEWLENGRKNRSQAGMS